MSKIRPRIALFTMLVFTILSSTLMAQVSLDGKWETEAGGPRGPDRITMEFKVTDGKVTGTIVRSAQADVLPTRLEGTLDKDKLSFAVTSPDGRRTISFVGTVKGDEIQFTREAKEIPQRGGPAAPGL